MKLQSQNSYRSWKSVFFLGLFFGSASWILHAQFSFQGASTTFTDEQGQPFASVKIEKGAGTPSGLIDVTGFRGERFHYDPPGSTNKIIELIITAPQSVFDKDSDSPSARSEESIQLQSGDGRFKLTGRGWLWNITDSLLIISNDVQTVIFPDAKTGIPNTENARTVKANSRELHYDLSKGVATYQREVTVDDGDQFQLTSGTLIVPLSSESGEPENVIAEDNVVIRLKQNDQWIETTGERTEYQALSEMEKLAVITGNPRWKSDRASGSGDRLVFDLAKNSFSVQTNAMMTLQSEDDGQTPVDIRSRHYVFTENQIDFTGGVSVTQTNNFSLNGNFMTASLTEGENSVDSINLIGEVNAEFLSNGEISRATGDEMTYLNPEQPDEKVEIKGDATWASGTQSGSGDKITIELASQRYQVEGNAKAILSPENLSEDVADSESISSEQPVIFESSAYELTPATGSFTGGVKTSQPGWEMTSEEILVDRMEDANAVRKAVAKGDVIINFEGNSEQSNSENEASTSDGMFRLKNTTSPWSLNAQSVTLLTDATGRTLNEIFAEENVIMQQEGKTATGEKLTYLSAEERFSLEGNPRVVDEDGRVLEEGGPGVKLYFDERTSQVSGKGLYRFKIPAKTLPEDLSANP